MIVSLKLSSGINVLIGDISKDVLDYLQRTVSFLFRYPENEHPPLQIFDLADDLMKKAQKKRVVIVTHSYLLSQQLSLYAEYRETSATTIPAMKFFSFYRENGKLLVESAPDLVAIKHNPILDAYIKHHDMEHHFFSKNLKFSAGIN